MRIDEIGVKKGTEVIIEAPSNPINATATAAITEAVAIIKGIREAYMPQVFAPGISETPAQVLVLVLSPSAKAEEVMNQLGPRLHEIVPQEIYLDVWPLSSSHELLEPVRQAGCLIWSAPERPWWKFWERG